MANCSPYLLEVEQSMRPTHRDFISLCTGTMIREVIEEFEAPQIPALALDVKYLDTYLMSSE